MMPRWLRNSLCQCIISPLHHNDICGSGCYYCARRYNSNGTANTDVDSLTASL